MTKKNEAIALETTKKVKINAKNLQELNESLAQKDSFDISIQSIVL